MIFNNEGDKEEFIQVASVAALVGFCASGAWSINGHNNPDLMIIARDARDVAVKLADELDVLPEPDMGDLFDKPKSR
tara:strand:+ start:257 stop:487 length:231 start_codon:yes stop_codon:yes gene_type:complete